MLSTPSILLLAIALGAGAGVVATSLTLSSLRDYSAIIFAPNSISLSGERSRPGPSDYGQAVATVREKTAPAAVEIFTAPSDATGAYEPGEGQASGFFITSDGWILTAPYSYYFSTDEAARVMVLAGGKIYPVQKFVKDSNTAVLFLKIEISNASVVSFGNALSPEAGDSLFVTASPGEIFVSSFFRSVRVGEISQAAEIINRRLELNTSIDSHFSGSAVANSSGEVIGLLVADQFGETKTVLPFTAVKPAVYSLLKEGKIVSLWFGAVATDLSQVVGYDETYTRGYNKGALLGTITKDSPAANVGLLRGDIVLSVGGLEISEKQSLSELLSDYHVGDTLNLVIDRGGTIIKIDLILGSH